MFRLFEPHVEAHAVASVSDGISTEPFSADGAVAGGGSSALPIRLQSGRLAYAKPARPQPGDVARERVAFLLGSRLDLPVATVLISRQTAGVLLALPPVVALSFDMLNQGRLWPQMKVTAAELSQLRPVLSALHVFHAWIDDHDHFNGSNTNAVRMAGGSIRLSTFDYSFSLTHEWHPPAPARQRAQWKNPGPPYAALDPLVIGQTVDQIKRLTLTELQAILATLPPDCLSAAEGAVLADGLFQRGQQLAAIIS